MELVISEEYDKKKETRLLYLFYKFYEDLNGREVFRLFSSPTYTTDRDKHKFLDRIDSNLNHAIASVEMINEQSNISIAIALDRIKTLLGVSRIITKEDELSICEILVDSFFEKESVIIFIINKLESFAEENGISTISLEIPWFDTTYYQIATQLGYQGPNISDIDHNRQRTFMMSKTIRKVENAKRVRNNKQTDEFN